MLKEQIIHNKFKVLVYFVNITIKILVSTKDGWLHLQTIINDVLSTSTQIEHNEQVVSI